MPPNFLGVTEADQTYVQENQPEGVPPLELTGERTLPDVPEENYWYRRHVAVYEWIADRCAGLRVVDLACGEGYGSNLLAERAAEVIGVDANPEAYEHARARYRRPNLSFRRELVEEFDEPVDAVVFLQTIEHIHEPDRLLAADRGHGARSPTSPPPTGSRSPRRAPRSRTTPGTCASTTRPSTAQLLEPHFERVEILGLFHARKLRAHELAIRLGWDRVHPALRITKPFYDRFIPAIRATDFRLRAARPRSRAGLRRALRGCSEAEPRSNPFHEVTMPERTRGDLAIVLHSHMPYVEGFGTYPFGEEWLFDAFARSHLPVLDVAERLTMTVTPVLADQLEADGVGERMLAFLRRHRVDAADRDVADAGAALRPAAKAEADHYTHAMRRLTRLGRNPLRAFQEAHRRGRIALMPSAATHAVLPKLATLAGRRLQVDAGLRSHERRFGEAHGFWLPECAYVAGLEGVLAERGHCLHLPRPELARARHRGAASDPAARRTGRVHDRLGAPSASSGRTRATQRIGAYLEYHRLSPNGMRLWSISGAPYDPAAAAKRATEHAASFLAAVRDRLERHRAETGQRGLCVFAIDTELLGHWWAEGPLWLREVIKGAELDGVRLLTLPQALREHEPEDRPAREASWGEGKSLETWDSPSVSDLVWATRRSELRLLRTLGARSIDAAAAARAARELLALQSSDWAFMDHRGQAGDYPYHARHGPR